MKTLAVLGCLAAVFSACEKAQTQTAATANVRQEIAARKAMREKVDQAAADYLQAVNAAALAQRGVSVYRKLEAAADQARMAPVPGVDLASERRKAKEAEARVLKARDTLIEAHSAYVALPNAKALPNYQAAILAHQERLEFDGEEASEGWYALTRISLKDLKP